MSDLVESEKVQRRVPYPGTEGAPTDSPHDMSHMVQIDVMIADLQKIRASFGNTCVYVRRGGLAWGAVALNRRAEDEKFGLFDLQARHDRDLIRHAGQVERLIESRNEQHEARCKAEAEIERLRAENERLTERCAIYKGQVLAGSMRIEAAEGERDTATRALAEMRVALEEIAAHCERQQVPSGLTWHIAQLARAALQKARQ